MAACGGSGGARAISLSVWARVERGIIAHIRPEQAEVPGDRQAREVDHLVLSMGLPYVSTGGMLQTIPARDTHLQAQYREDR